MAGQVLSPVISTLGLCFGLMFSGLFIAFLATGSWKCRELTESQGFASLDVHCCVRGLGAQYPEPRLLLGHSGGVALLCS